jgi:hypothetical protein
MASLIFLMIHPIEYPIYCGGKGKAMMLTGKGYSLFCCRTFSQLPVSTFRQF